MWPCSSCCWAPQLSSFRLNCSPVPAAIRSALPTTWRWRGCWGRSPPSAGRWGLDSKTTASSGRRPTAVGSVNAAQIPTAVPPGLNGAWGSLGRGTIEASDPVGEQQRSCLRGRRTGTRLSTMTESYRSTDDIDPCVRVYGTRVHNLRGVDVVAPRDALVAFTGISGSGKSSLAFGTIYAEAQRRYFESVAPYARRLLLPTGAPKVDDITGLPPAVALQQRRGSATSRSTVGTVTTLSNLLRM